MNLNLDLSLIITVQDRDRTVAELEAVEGRLFQTNQGTWPDILSETVSARTRDLILAAKAMAGSKVEADAGSDVVWALKQALLALPVARLTLAFDPKHRFLEEITGLIRAKTHTNYIIGYQTDPEIIAGVKLEINGRINDYSLRPKLESFFAAHESA